jgi:peptidoglycan/xylan/chitin deacetylase (PgdA/CDA1 family)
MRLAAAICAVIIIAGLGVFGAVLAQKGTLLGSVPAVSSASVPTRVASAAITPPPVIADITPAVSTPEPARAAPQVFAQAVPAPASQTVAQPPAPIPAALAPASPVAPAPVTCSNPDALGVARVVEIDTTGGPGFGFEHFKSHDFLRPGEVVLTFDDGPWPRNTPAVLAALAAQCTKALFFPIGKHSMWHPEILKQVAAAGHTIGSHTWSHADLSKKSLQEAKDEIEKGFSAVRWAIGAPAAPFFRFPALRHPPEAVTYLGERNVGIFSTDFDSFDFKMRKPDQVVQSVMTKLKKFGKGIALMHDFQHATADAAADLLKQLKAGGYKIVLLKGKEPLKTIASYDELIVKDMKLPTVSTRPTSSVVRTISE